MAVLSDIRQNPILISLALLAVGVVIGSGTHVHHDGGGVHCWLCIAAVGMLGVAAVVTSSILPWRIVDFLILPFVTAPDSHRDTPRSSRAPPLLNAHPIV
ncbi:MAG: hypothetical protein Kow0074_09350 [Candidatus Zixiibacteriota bacterium]